MKATSFDLELLAKGEYHRDHPDYYDKPTWEDREALWAAADQPTRDKYLSRAAILHATLIA